MIARMDGTMRWSMLVTTLFLSACIPPLKVEGYRCSDFVDAKLYYDREEGGRLAEGRGYPIEKQYAVYICSRQYIRPPLPYGKEPLAERGKMTMDFLKTKLQSKQSDLVVRDILDLIAYMDTSDRYEADEDQELMLLLETAVSRMRDEFWRKFAQEDLQRIRRH